jgi:hypothetical protein
MQTKADPLPPSVLGKDGKLKPRWTARVIGFEPGIPIEFFSMDELKGSWAIGGGDGLRFEIVG